MTLFGWGSKHVACKISDKGDIINTDYVYGLLLGGLGFAGFAMLILNSQVKRQARLNRENINVRGSLGVEMANLPPSHTNCYKVATLEPSGRPSV